MVKLIIPLSTSKNVRYRKYLAEAVKDGKTVSRDPRTISGFEQYESEVVEVVKGHLKKSTPEFQTYGASINKITMSIIGERCTINLKVRDELVACRDIDEVSRTFGDSVEKTLHINWLMNIEKGLTKDPNPIK
jgi:hypothetical protein